MELPNTLSWLNGLSDAALVGVAALFAIYFILQYRTNRKKYYPFVILVMICEVIGFSGILVGFITLLAIGSISAEIQTVVSIFSYSTVSIGVLCCLYLAWDIFYPPEAKRKAMIFFTIFAVGWYPIVYGFFNENIIRLVPAGEMMDDSLKYFSVPWFLLLGFAIVVLLSLAWSFYRLRAKLTGADRLKATYLFWAFTLLCIGVPADTLMLSEWIFIFRVLLVLSLYCWYRGMKPEQARK